MALLSQAAWARDAAVTVVGESLEEPAFVENGVAYAPLAPLLEALGYGPVSWDQPSRTASAETALFSLAVPVGRDYVLADGCFYSTGSASTIRGGRTYVPLRAMANLLGAQVLWQGWNAPIAVTAAAGSPAYTEEDFYWLSRIISAESQGESLYGQVAVGNVVLNRVASDQFPDTIRGVVFDQKDAVQFEPVANGTIYNEPTEQSVLAAKLVLSGTEVVPGCLYFFNPSLSQGLWIRQNRSYYTTIGCHMFYR